jgi:hypothetical protein
MTKTNTSAKAVLDTILQHSPVTTKRFASLAIGERVRQGDIYLIRVPNTHPHGKPWGSRQVAVGNTIGSRHVAVGDLEVFAGVPDAIAKMFPKFTKEQREACCGPVVKGRATWDLEHPEHPDYEMAQPKECDLATYQVTYQWDEKKMAPVVD